jgi:hypothetical protein
MIAAYFYLYPVVKNKGFMECIKSYLGLQARGCFYGSGYNIYIYITDHGELNPHVEIWGPVSLYPFDHGEVYPPDRHIFSIHYCIISNAYRFSMDNDVSYPY